MLMIASGRERPSGGPEVLRLEGKLVGLWVAEVRRVCEAILSRPGGQVTLDLKDVTFVDTEGLALLRELSARRAGLVNCSPFTAELLRADTPTVSTGVVTHEVRSGRSGAHAPCDEAALLTALRAGHDWAYETAVRRFGPRLLDVARRFTRDETGARALVQQVCLSVFRSLDGLGERKPLWSTLRRAVVRMAIEDLRSRQEEPDASIESLLPRFNDDGGHVQAVRDDDFPTDAALGREPARAAVRACIARLPEWHQAVLLLCDVEGFSSEEAAEELATTPATARLQLDRARQALSTLLREHFVKNDLVN